MDIPKCHIYSTIYIILLKIGWNLVQTQDLYSFPLTNASVYASSVGQDSSPTYVIDDDFYRPQPTCFRWDDSAPDVQGFHWLLIDFGVKLHQIAEVRIILGPNANLAPTGNSTIDVFLTRSLSIPKHTLIQQQRTSHSLPWTSFEQPCTNLSIQPQFASTTITLQCSILSDARWLIVRTTGPSVSICLINVYIAHAFRDCFLPVRSPTQFQGAIYRSIRHIRHIQCQEQCARSAECKAIFCVNRRYSGICQLVHSFRRRTDKLKPGHIGFECPWRKCNMEINYCNRGNSFALKSEASVQDVTNGQSHLVQTWSVEYPNSWNTESEQSEFLASVQFVGHIECSEWDCGLLYIYSVGLNNQESVCAYINTKDFSLLTNIPFMCKSLNISAPRTIRLLWKQLGTGRLKLSLTSGIVRLTNEHVETLINEMKAEDLAYVASTKPSFVTTTRHDSPEKTTIESTTSEIVRSEEEALRHTIELSNENTEQQHQAMSESLASLNFSTSDETMTEFRNSQETEATNEDKTQMKEKNFYDGQKMVNDDTDSATRGLTERTHRQVVEDERPVQPVVWKNYNSTGSKCILSFLLWNISLCILLFL